MCAAWSLVHFLFLALQETALNPTTAAVNDESVSTSLAATEERTGDGEEEFLLQGICMIMYVWVCEQLICEREIWLESQKSESQRQGADNIF